MAVYIQSKAQITNQLPLCDSWFEQPILPNESYSPIVEADYKSYLPPAQLRRMGQILRRALTTATVALRTAEIANPAAIISGTGLGCIGETEKFLLPLLQEDEQFLHPTHFMQSTHNTISAQIAQHLHCHHYNSTYSHNGTSFDMALLDAFMQLSENEIDTALVGGYEALTPTVFALWKKVLASNNSVHSTILGECSVSFVLQNRRDARSLCQLHGVELLYRPSSAQLQEAVTALLHTAGLQPHDLSAVWVGTNGSPDNDGVYHDFLAAFFPAVPAVGYKHVFGESFSANAVCNYLAITCLEKGAMPQFLLLNPEVSVSQPQHFLLYNHSQSRNHSLILLSKC